MDKAILIGGKFQDNAGNPLSFGWITLTLGHDENASFLGANSGSQVISGVTTKITLDINGNLTANTGIWTNDLLLPSGSYYTVRAYNSSGLQVWLSPQIWTLTYSATIDVGSIIPTTP